MVTPAIFGAAGMIPPATLYFLFQWVIVGLAFNLVVRRMFFGWWSRYTYAMSGALDIGTALCTVVTGLGLGLSETNFPDWWGNLVWQNTLDANGEAVTRVFNINTTKPLGPESW